MKMIKRIDTFTIEHQKISEIVSTLLGLVLGWVGLFYFFEYATNHTPPELLLKFVDILSELQHLLSQQIDGKTIVPVISSFILIIWLTFHTLYSLRDIFAIVSVKDEPQILQRRHVKWLL